MLLTVLDFDQKLIPAAFFLAQQVKVNIFLIKNQTVHLLVEEGDAGEVLAWEQKFDDFNEKFFVLGRAYDHLEGGVAEQVGVVPGTLMPDYNSIAIFSNLSVETYNSFDRSVQTDKKRQDDLTDCGRRYTRFARYDRGLFARYDRMAII